MWNLLTRRCSRLQAMGWTGLGTALALGGVLLCAAPAVAQDASGVPPAAAPEAPVADPPAAPELPQSEESAAPRAKDDGKGYPLRVPLESVDDEGKVKFASDRPDWVEQPPVMTGDVHYWSVKSDYHLREHDALRALDEALVVAAREYIVDYLGSAQATLFFSFDAPSLKERFVNSEYRETIVASVGTMHQMHAQLEFPREFQEEMEARWSKVISAIRLFRTVGVAAGILGLIAVLFAYFRLDTATRGYYTLRLKLLAAVAILAVVVLGVAFSRSSIVWVQWLL